MISGGMARVNIAEIIQDTRVPSFPGVYGALVFPAKKGPVGDAFSGGAVLCTSDTQFLKIFTPDEKIAVDDAGGMWDAMAFFPYSDTLWARRVVSDDVLYGGAIVLKAGAAGNNQGFTSGVADPEAFTFGSNDSFIVVGANPGAWINGKTDPIGIAIRLYTYTNFPTKVKVSGAFIIEVYKKPNLNDAVESWTCSKTPGTRDGFGNNIYLEDVLRGSEYIRVVDNTAVADTYPQDNKGGIWTFDFTGHAGSGYVVNDVLTVTTGDGTATLLVTAVSGTGAVTRATVLTPGEGYVRDASTFLPCTGGSGSNFSCAVTGVGLFLAAGEDGTYPTDAEMIVALSEFENSEDKQVTLLMDGGWATAAFASELWGLAENRKDCVAILSTAYEAEANSDYLNEILNYRRSTLNANTSYAALYTPHVKIYDKFNSNYRYAPPDGYAAAAISYTGAQFEMWYPPAGNVRGTIVMFSALDVRRRFSVGEIGTLFDAGINPLRWAPGKGIRIWGDKTLWATPSSLEALNVRLLLIVIEPALKEALESFIFELNTIEVRARIKSMIDAYMADILARMGVTFFNTVCDATNNTPVDIQNFRLNVDLSIVPSYPVRYINLRVILTPPSNITITAV